MKFLKGHNRTAGDKAEIDKEPIISNLSFNIHKFNKRPRPENNKNILAFCAFGEMGTEFLLPVYIIPTILEQHCGKYSIMIGWHGRAYLYKHLVDEFWEIKEEFMFLREYARAFHHESKNLKKLEIAFSKDFGVFYNSNSFSAFVNYGQCQRCLKFCKEEELCPECGTKSMTPAIFKNIDYWRNNKAVKIPTPSEEVMNWAKNIVKPNCVGIFARNRKTYGRNFPKEYYIKLINKLKEKGYEIIWLGEPISTLACPDPFVFDFSRTPDAGDLEKTFAIISLLKFTVQYYTASTRLASVMQTSSILQESPCQIWGITNIMAGQEGLRRRLFEFAPSKLIACDFKDAMEDLDKTLEYTETAIQEIEANNFETITAFPPKDQQYRDHIIKTSLLAKQGG